MKPQLTVHEHSAKGNQKYFGTLLNGCSISLQREEGREHRR